MVISAPLAAGFELLNPALETAPPEAKADHADSRVADLTERRDARMEWSFLTLPKGTYDLYFRARATTPGRFTQPAAQARMTYQPSTRGRSAGAWVEILR